ncbi:MAG TPA: hypothetical protein ENN60_00295 [archaeon]|nr:hypothetical protein [archaeon]
MKGIGVPEIVISVGLLLVLLAGFLPGGTRSQSKEVLLLSQEVGRIGAGNYDYKHIPLVSSMMLARGVDGTPLITQKESREVAKGIITTQEHTVRFSIPASTMGDLDTATLLLEIDETNNYGPLILTLNGNEIWKDFPGEGRLEVELPIAYLQSENSLKLSAGSSGWRIWAPTIYKIEELKVMETLSRDEEQTFTFTLSKDELKNYYMGRVYVGYMNPQISGELAITLNNENVIFRGEPGTGAFNTAFSSGIRETNTISFKLLKDGYYEMRNVEVVIFTRTNASSIFVTNFEVEPVNLAQLRDGSWTGVIEIRVNVAADDILRVTLSSETDRQLYEAKAPEGLLELAFTGDEVSSTNRLMIESPNVYEITDVKIKLVKNS